MQKPAGLKEAKGITYDDEASCSTALLTAKRALEALRAKKASLAAKLVAHKAKAPSLGAEGSRDLRAGAPKAKRTAELCCGCARYSFHLQLAGAKIMPIDKATNPHETHVPVITLDLANPADQALLMTKARAHEFDYVHAAPPCGTSTRARDKRVPLWLQRLGAPDPKPLRSTLEPEGVQGLTPFNRMKVEQANSIYKFLAAFFMLCSSLGILWSCEDPLRSYA